MYTRKYITCVPTQRLYSYLRAEMRCDAEAECGTLRFTSFPVEFQSIISLRFVSSSNCVAHAVQPAEDLFLDNFENELEQYRVERTRLYNQVLSPPAAAFAAARPPPPPSSANAADAAAAPASPNSNPSASSASGAEAAARVAASDVPTFYMTGPAFEQHYLADTALLVPPLATPFSRIALHKRLPCGADEQFKLVCCLHLLFFAPASHTNI